MQNSQIKPDVVILCKVCRGRKTGSTFLFAADEPPTKVFQQSVKRISYDDSTVFVTITKEAIQQASEYHVPPLGDEYCDTHGFEENC